MKQGSIFRRATLWLGPSTDPAAEKAAKTSRPGKRAVNKTAPRGPSMIFDSQDTPPSVLVINSSREMATEMTHQLTLNIPGCAITYAPSIQLAIWILKRRRMDLVVSSPVLPDGGVRTLQRTMAEMESPPDLVVVGELSARNALEFNLRGYEFATCKRIGKMSHSSDCARTDRPRLVSSSEAKDTKPERIKDLGADIRNDLNNPLQEIVAMVFVAQAAAGVNENTAQALLAIDRAAQNMASYVSGLEEKIREAVRA